MTQLVRRYDIGGLIAEGGMAEIVAASAMTEAGVSKRVALKRIRTASSSDPQFVARFFDEVRLAMQLSHANVVQVFDFGRTEDNAFFLAMEFVEGVDVQRLRRLPDGGRLPPAEALHVVAQMLRGLDYAHRRTDSDNRPLGIVHMDVKPANVLVSFEGEVKLTDFGVARSRDVRRPMVGISGTIPFMSPEQTRGSRSTCVRTCSRRACCSTRCSPASARSARRTRAQTLHEIQQCRYRPPAGLERHERFDPLLERALALRPDDRFASAGAFADAIDELMFAQGWRGGAGALRDRLRAAFPHERERLNALFDPGRQREGLAVMRAASAREGTVLSRVVAAAPAARAAGRQTVVAAALRRARADGAGELRRRSGSQRWRRPARSCCCGRGRRRLSRRWRPRTERRRAAPETPRPPTTTTSTAAATPTAAPPTPAREGTHGARRDGNDLGQRQPVGHRSRQRQARRDDADPAFPGARRSRVGDNREPEAGAKAGRREDRTEEGHAADRRPAHRG